MTERDGARRLAASATARRVDRRRGDGARRCRRSLHVARVPGLRARGALRPRVAVRRARRARSPSPATGSRSPSATSRSSSPADKTGAINACRRSASTGRCRSCDGAGQLARTFKCPYHHWIYGLDGRLLGAPAMERTEGFDKTDFPLPALRGRAVAGLRVRQHRSRRRAARRRRSPATSRTSSTTTSTDAVCPGTFTLTDLPWNWKVMFENFNDGYHANRLHQYVQDFCPSDADRRSRSTGTTSPT